MLRGYFVTSESCGALERASVEEPTPPALSHQPLLKGGRVLETLITESNKANVKNTELAFGAFSKFTLGCGCFLEKIEEQREDWPRIGTELAL